MKHLLGCDNPKNILFGSSNPLQMNHKVFTGKPHCCCMFPQCLNKQYCTGENKNLSNVPKKYVDSGCDPIMLEAQTSMTPKCSHTNLDCCPKCCAKEGCGCSRKFKEPVPLPRKNVGCCDYQDIFKCAKKEFLEMNCVPSLECVTEITEPPSSCDTALSTPTCSKGMPLFAPSM